MSDNIQDLCYISIPPKDNLKVYTREWLDFSKILISAFMTDSWIIETYPNALERRCYLEEYVNEFYEQAILKNNGAFATIKLKGSKYPIIGGFCLETNITDSPYFEHPKNVDEIRFNYMNKMMTSSLIAVAEKYNAETWYMTKQAIEPGLKGLKIASAFTMDAYRLLVNNKLMEYERCGKSLPHPPFVYGVALNKAIYEHMIKQGFVDIGSVTYHDKSFGEATDYVTAMELPGTRTMLQEARSGMKSVQSTNISKL